MSILIDSSVWSLGLRRRKRQLNPTERQAYYAWEQLLIQGEAALVGPITQEVLSGIASPREFESIKQHLALIPELSLTSHTFLLAAEFFNTCRGAGISPGAIDMTLCAAAHLHATPIFTTDPDFVLYATCLPITLHRY